MAMYTWDKPFSVQKAIVWLDGPRTTSSPTSMGTPQSQDAQCSDWELGLDGKEGHDAREQSSEWETGARQGGGLLLHLTSSIISEN